MSRTGWRPPPNWPSPPEGWTPPPGWRPDPAWGPAPPGWSFRSGPDDVPHGEDQQDADTPDDGAPAGGPVLGQRASRRWRRNEAGLRGCLEPGEDVRAFFLANAVRPPTDFVVVTSTRVFAGHTSGLARTPPQLRSARLADVVEFLAEPASLTRLPKISARQRDGSLVFLGQLQATEDEDLLRSVAALPDTRPSTPAPRPTAAPTSLPAPPVAPVAPVAPASAPRGDLSLTPPAQDPGERAETDGRISRLLDDAVIDEAQARYLRSVLLP